MYQLPSNVRLRRPLPTGKVDYIIMSFPLSWSLKRNFGLIEPIPEAFNKIAFIVAVQTVKGLLNMTPEGRGPSGVMKPQSGRDYVYPQNVKPDETAFSVVDLFWREGVGRNPGNNPIYQALVGTAIMRGITRSDTFSPLEIRNLLKSLNLGWGDKRIDFEIDRLLTREEVRPCLLERNPISGEWRFPLQAWLEVPVIQEDELRERKLRSLGIKPTIGVGRPRSTPVEEILRDGPMTTADLISKLARKLGRATVTSTLNRLKHEGRVVHLERGKWSLPVDNSTAEAEHLASSGVEMESCPVD